MRVNFFLGLLLSIESSAVIVYQFQLLTFTNVSCSILSLAPLSMESCIAKVNRSHWYLPSGEICAAFEIGVGIENCWIREAAHSCEDYTKCSALERVFHWFLHSALDRPAW